jgi:hypothetical protein
VGRGFIHRQRGELRKALADMKEAVRLNPKNPNALVQRGRSYCDLGDMENAHADINRALELDPKYADAYLNRGIVFQNQGKHDKAIADFNETLRLNPTSAWGYYHRGKSYRASGRRRRQTAISVRHGNSTRPSTIDPTSALSPAAAVERRNAELVARADAAVIVWGARDPTTRKLWALVAAREIPVHVVGWEALPSKVALTALPEVEGRFDRVSSLRGEPVSVGGWVSGATRVAGGSAGRIARRVATGRKAERLEIVGVTFGSDSSTAARRCEIH